MINIIKQTDNYYGALSNKKHRVFEVLDAITVYEVTITFKNSIPTYRNAPSKTFNFEPLNNIESYKQIKLFIIGDSITFSGGFAGATPYKDAFYGQENFNLDKFTIQSSSPFSNFFDIEEAVDKNNKKHIFFRSSIRDTYATYRVYCHNNSLCKGIENNNDVNYTFSDNDYTTSRTKNAVYTQIDSANNFSPKLKISVNKPYLIISVTNNNAYGLFHLSGTYNYPSCGLIDVYIEVAPKVSNIIVTYGANNIYPVSIQAYKYTMNNNPTADIVIHGLPFLYSKCCSLEYNIDFNYLNIANEDNYAVKEDAKTIDLVVYKKGGKTEERPNIGTNFGNISYYYDTTIKKFVIFNGQEWKAFDGNDADAKRYGTTEERPINQDIFVGFEYFDTTLSKPIYWTGTKWVDSGGNGADSTPITSGTFANKPTGVKVGYAYFCTDRQTIEGTINGIMIYYKGSNTWVDALGRVVS